MATDKITQRTPILYWLTLAIMFAALVLAAVHPAAA
jgi:hypothetical protein